MLKLGRKRRVAPLFSAGQNKGASSTDQARLKERYRQKIKGLRLIDDEFMTRVFDGYLEGASLLVKTILGLSDLKITEVKTQRTLKSLQERSLRLDIHAMDSAGRIYNVEVQRADSGAPMATMRRGWL